MIFANPSLTDPAFYFLAQYKSRSKRWKNTGNAQKVSFETKPSPLLAAPMDEGQNLEREQYSADQLSINFGFIYCTVKKFKKIAFTHFACL